MWAAAVTVGAAAAPAFAAYACNAVGNHYSDTTYQWGMTATSPATTQATNQQLAFWVTTQITSLPSDAVVTSWSFGFVFKVRNDGLINPNGSSDAAGTGSYDPGNSKASTITFQKVANAGTTSNTSYSTIMGCPYTTDANGCKSTPVYYLPEVIIDYANVLQAKPAEQSVLVETTVRYTYTSGGQTYTKTTVWPNNTICGTRC